MLALCYVGLFSVSAVLNLLVNLPSLVKQGEWGLLLCLVGFAGLTSGTFVKVLGLAAVHVTSDGIEVYRYRRVRAASWDEIAQIQFTQRRYRWVWFLPPVLIVTIGRIRFSDGQAIAFVADRFAPEIWSSRAPRALALKKKWPTPLGGRFLPCSGDRVGASESARL
jgi:hypothetical protein